MTAASNFFFIIRWFHLWWITSPWAKKKYGEPLDSVFALPAQGWILMERHCRHYL
jgi:hypothetical protein